MHIHERVVVDQEVQAVRVGPPAGLRFTGPQYLEGPAFLARAGPAVQDLVAGPALWIPEVLLEKLVGEADGEVGMPAGRGLRATSPGGKGEPFSLHQGTFEMNVLRELLQFENPLLQLGWNPLALLILKHQSSAP